MDELSDMPLLPFSTAPIISHCRNFSTRSSDIFIASYPKSGTTWLQNIVYTLLSNGDSSFTHISDYAPFFEHQGMWLSELKCNAVSKKSCLEWKLIESKNENHRKIKRRMFNTHLRRNMMPFGNGVEEPKVIYVVRSAKDVAVSFYHHMTNMGKDDGGIEVSFDTFFKLWLNGEIAFGSWFDHLRSWLSDKHGGCADGFDAYSSEGKKIIENSNNKTILIVQFSKLKSNLKSEVKRIASFLNIPVTNQQLEKYLPHFSIEYMKANKQQFHPTSVKWKEGYEFIRKGVVGDHKMLFTTDQYKLYNEKINDTFPTGIPHWAKTLL